MDEGEDFLGASHKIRVYEAGFAFETEVLVSENAKEIVQFLREKGCYKCCELIEGGFFIRLADGKYLHQGYQNFDRWIEQNS